MPSDSSVDPGLLLDYGDVTAGVGSLELGFITGSGYLLFERHNFLHRLLLSSSSVYFDLLPDGRGPTAGIGSIMASVGSLELGSIAGSGCRVC